MRGKSKSNTKRPSAITHQVPPSASSATSGAASGETAQYRAYTILKDAVLAGQFSVGEVVTLRALAKRFGLGEMPVREALRRLTSEGAFESLPNRSARVPSMTRARVEQIQELRRDLEAKSAAAAARNITLVQIERLREVHAEMQRCLTSDTRKFAALNMAFHFEIYRIADNPVLLDLIQMLWLRMAPAVASAGVLLSSKPLSVRRAGLRTHERLLDALQARDPAATESAMRKDLAVVMELPGYWESLGLAST